MRASFSRRWKSWATSMGSKTPEDLTGRRFGRLVVLAKTERQTGRCYFWRCRCDCGKEKDVLSSRLKDGTTRSCGCLIDETLRKDVTDRRYGHLTAVRKTEKRGLHNSTIWVWRCDCGAEIERSLRSVSDADDPMCPKCLEQKNKVTMEKIRSKIEKFETGCAQKTVEYIREGKPNANNSSGVRGVSWKKDTKKWWARIEINGKTRSLGYYTSLEDAARAREEAIAQIYGTEDEKTEK